MSFTNLFQSIQKLINCTLTLEGMLVDIVVK